jgi:exodeoxyribonuclease VII large subunit
VRACQRELVLLRARPVLRQPRLLLAERQQRVDELRLAVGRQARELLRLQGERAGKAKEKLLVLSPGATLARGYAMVRRPGGEIVHSVRQLAVGEAAEVLLQDGTAEVETTGIRPSEAQMEERRDATGTG